jgi:hypothetical protein
LHLASLEEVIQIFGFTSSGVRIATGQLDKGTKPAKPSGLLRHIQLILSFVAEFNPLGGYAF